MEVLLQHPAESAHHGITAQEEQRIQHHRMALLEGTVPLGIFALEKHQILSHVRMVPT